MSYLGVAYHLQAIPFFMCEAVKRAQFRGPGIDFG